MILCTAYDSVLKCQRQKSDPILNHLNNIEPGVIRFTKEEEVDNKLPSLDLEMNVNRKKKKVEFNVYYKKTNTNITIKKRSNHKESVKKAVIKGYADRARALCDPEYLQSELNNIIEVFKDNGYSAKEVNEAIKEKTDSKRRDNTDNETERGIIVMPNIPNFTCQYNKIARKHGFRVANKTENRVRDLITNAKTPLGKKNTNVVYDIPCKCQKHGYTGETDRKWESREKEHQDKVKLTKRDIEAGNLENASRRMNEGDGGLARHSTTCPHDIDWENARIVGREQRWTQRKYLEGIETLRKKNEGRIPLNSYNKLEQWQPVLYSFFKT